MNGHRGMVPGQVKGSTIFVNHPPFGGLKNGTYESSTHAAGCQRDGNITGNPTQAAQPNARIVYIIGTKDISIKYLRRLIETWCKYRSVVCNHGGGDKMASKPKGVSGELATAIHKKITNAMSVQQSD